MPESSNRLGRDSYPWVALRGPAADIEDAARVLRAAVGEEAFACANMTEVAPGILELDYRKWYYPISTEALTNLVKSFPSLKLKAINPKLYKYSSQHKRAYSKAGWYGCVETIYRSEYTKDDYPHYSWWNKDEPSETAGLFGSSGVPEEDLHALERFKIKVGKEGITIAAYWGAETSVSIPSFIGGKPVVAIGEGAFSEPASVFLNDFNLQDVEIPASVVKIGDRAFWGCIRLSQVLFERDSCLTSVGREAFADTNLTSIALPSKVVELGEEAFRGVPNVTVGDGNESYSSDKGMLFSKDMSVLLHAVVSNADEVVIPEGTREISPGAFGWCAASRIVLPSSLETIGDHAFRGEIRAIEFAPRSHLKKIGRGAFEGALTLETLSLPEGIEEIGESAFADCPTLAFLGLPSSVTAFEKWLGKRCEVPVFAPGIPLANVRQRQSKSFMAAGFVKGMAFGGDVKPDAKKGYIKYAKAHSGDILEKLDFDIVCLRWMVYNGCVAAKDATALANTATKMGKEEQAALLRRFAEEHRPKERSATKSSRGRTEKPKAPTATELRKIWGVEKLPDGTYKITSWKGSSPSVAVPDRIGNTRVTVIGKRAFEPRRAGRLPANNDARENVLEEVVVAEGIVEIEAHAFRGCSALRRVELPHSIKTLRYRLFDGDTLDRLVSHTDASLEKALDGATIAELYIKGRIGRATECNLEKVFLHSSMPEKTRASVEKVIGDSWNVRRVVYGEWETASLS